MVDWNVNSLVHCCAPAVQSEEIHAGRLFIGHHSALRHRGDGPKAAYHSPSDRVKITYGDSLVTGDVRTLTLATVSCVASLESTRSLTGAHSTLFTSTHPVCQQFENKIHFPRSVPL
jgi:hypothetical protein